jgi:putative inorganic carbon (HCO3(-)) transporter
MTAQLAHVGGAVGALGLALLILGPSRWWRLGGLAGWAFGCATLVAWLAPAGHHRVYAAGALAGLVLALAGMWLFIRVPWLLAVAVLACAPARIPVSVGSTTANLLVPMYLVVAAVALALGWQLLWDGRRVRELGAFAWPLALFVGWSGLAFLWSDDRRQGAIFLLFFVLPFGLIAVSLSRLKWRIGWVATLYGQLALMGLVFAVLGIEQYLTRNIYWNPKVAVDNAYATSSWFYRVNSVFYDPSIYGRFLVVAILASLVLVLFKSPRVAWAAAAIATVTWTGLVPSFSQSSFVALAAGIVVALAVFWRRHALIPLVVAAAVLVVVTFGVPQARHRIFGHQGLSHATSGRSKLVSNGIALARDHPLIGVGTGGFRRAYADRTGLKGKNPKAAASHTTPITVAAETGLPGLLLLGWLVFMALVVPLRRVPLGTATGHARVAFGLALIAIVVHSLFYNALFEDPLFWGLLALTAVAVREPA